MKVGVIVFANSGFDDPEDEREQFFQLIPADPSGFQESVEGFQAVSAIEVFLFKHVLDK